MRSKLEGSVSAARRDPPPTVLRWWSETSKERKWFCQLMVRIQPRRISNSHPPLSGFELCRDRSPDWDHPGLYLGDTNDFADIVNFWNLRAVGAG